MNFITLKILFGNDLRRFPCDIPEKDLTFEHVHNLVAKHFGEFILNHNIKFSYKDDEGDNINVFDTQELTEAIRLIPQNNHKILRLTLHLLDEKLHKAENSMTLSLEESTFEDEIIVPQEMSPVNQMEDLPLIQDFVMINNENLPPTQETKNLFERTYDKFSNLSSKIAHDISESSSKVSQKMQKQINDEQEKKQNGFDTKFNENLSNNLHQNREKAQNYVDELCNQEKKTNDYSHIFEAIKKFGEKTTLFVKDLSELVDNNIKEFCDYSIESINK